MYLRLLLPPVARSFFIYPCLVHLLFYFIRDFLTHLVVLSQSLKDNVRRAHLYIATTQKRSQGHLPVSSLCRAGQRD